MVCNVVTYRARSALRDAAKALVFPADVIDRTAKALDTRSTATVAESIEQAAAGAAAQSSIPGFEDAIPLPWQILARLLRQMDGLPRHLSIHVGGMLITAAPLVEVVPLERATMPGRVVVQWDKDSVEDAGLIKIDLLSLRTLGAVEEAVQLIRAEYGCQLAATSPSGQALDDLPLDDPAVYRLLRRADTVVGVALIRPGPIQGGMVHPYLKRRQGVEPVVYPHPCLEAALGETLGVIVFQEQVLRVAMAIAGFGPTEADQLRRAMSRSRSEEAMAALQARFLAGARANGIEAETT
jgi:error-prone DNA polymerase